MSSIYSQATQTLIWLGENWTEQLKHAALLPPNPYRIDPRETPLTETNNCLDIICRLVNSWYSEVVANYEIRGKFVAGKIDSQMPTLQGYEWDWLKDFFKANWWVFCRDPFLLSIGIRTIRTLFRLQISLIFPLTQYCFT